MGFCVRSALKKKKRMQCRRYRFDPWVGKIPWRMKGNPLQYSCMENPVDREAWWATVHEITKSRTLLSNHTTTRRRQWHPTLVLLPGKSHGWRSLVGCSPWGREELDMTEWLHFHFSLSCTGEGNGNPLQCSCLENPRDSRAWWAAVYGVAQSRTRLKRLSSSSSSSTPPPSFHN